MVAEASEAVCNIFALSLHAYTYYDCSHDCYDRIIGININADTLPDCYLAGARVVSVSVSIEAEHDSVGDLSAALIKEGEEVQLWSAVVNSCPFDDVDVKLRYLCFVHLCLQIIESICKYKQR